MISVKSTGGEWEFTRDGTSWSAIPAIEPDTTQSSITSDALLLGPEGFIRFRPDSVYVYVN